MTITVAGALDGSEDDQTQSELWSKIPVTPHRKEALLRALSNLDLMQREATPEIAQEVVSRHFDHYLKNPELPPLVADFLDRHLRFYLATLYVLEGGQSKSWRSALDNAEKLIWSVQPKCDEDDRQRFYALLPGLLQWIHTVLNARQVEVSEEDVFFSQLARFHVAALNAESKPVDGLEMSAVVEPTVGRGSAADRNVGWDGTEDGAERAGSARSHPKIDQPSSAESDVLRDLTVGTWVEFQSERETKRVLRLEWISRSGGVYLFRDVKRGDALCLTAHRCIQCLRERSASVLR